MTDGGNSTTCSGTFFDSGGAAGNYNNNATLVHTICPDVPGECLLIDFQSFQVEAAGLIGQTDVLSVYDGNSTAAPLLTEYEGNFNGTTFPVASSNGCLTFEFTSDVLTTQDGWEATISCTPCPLPQDVAQQDCIGAIPVCEEFYFQPNSYNGFGTVAEINEAFSCLGDGEVNAVWYVFTAQQSGDLSFIITPVDPCDDYDWAIWDITGVSCADIFPNNGLAPIVSCNYSDSQVSQVFDSCPLEDNGQTGAFSGVPYNGVGNSAIDNEEPYNQDIPVIAGNTYVLNVSNFSSTQSGYYLDFRPSSGILFDTAEPEIVDIVPPVNCWDINLTVQFSEPVLCSSIQPEDFEIFQPDGSVMTAVNASAGLCNVGEYTTTIDLVLFPRITQSGTYTVNLVGDIEDNCGNIGNNSSFTFETDFVDADAGPDLTLCEGEMSSATIGGSPTSNEPTATYNWTADPAVGTTFLTATDVANPGFIDASIIPPGTYTYIVETSVLGDVNNAASTCNALDTVVVIVGVCCANDTTPPEITGVQEPINCWDIFLTLEFSEPVLCSSIDINDFSIIQPDGSPINVASVSSNECNVGSLTNTINLLLFPRITQTGTHTVTLVGNIEDNCGNVATGTVIQFETDFVEVDAGPDITFCSGDDPMASLGGSPTSPTTDVMYNWTSDPIGAVSFLDATDIANPALINPEGMPPGVYEYVVEAFVLGDVNNASSNCSVTDTLLIVVNDCCNINLMATPTNASCNGDIDGSIILDVTGGTAPITFDWDNAPDVQNPTGLGAGIYVVTVTDNIGCSVTTSTTITEPTAIVADQIDSTNPNCGNADGAVTITSVSGGTAPYEYDFGSGFSASNSAGSLAAGVYNVVIQDASACTETIQVSLTDNGGPSIDNTIVTDADCGNAEGAATVEVSGGTWPYSFNWENAIVPGTSISTDSLATGLSAGTYNVTVSSNFGGMSTPVYTEDFDGANTWILNTPTGPNGDDNNFWQINDTEGGVAPGGCGTGGNGDNTLHVTSVFNPAGGAAYDAGGLCGILFCPETNMRAESPNISTVGFTGLTLTFDYIGNGDGLLDNASLLYSTDGGTNFTVLDPSLKSNVCASSQGEWTQNSYTLPAVCENINNLRLAFNWTNNDDALGTDPSFAVNNIIISTMNGGTQCIATASVMVAGEAGVNINLTSALPATCNNATGEASVTVSGGNMPYTFNWENITTPGVSFSMSNPATNLPAGTYSVTVTDADGCIDASVITVDNEPGPALSNPVSTPSSCGAADGTATITATGGTPPYQYSWANVLTPATIVSATNPATGLTPGDYSVTVTNADGTCPVTVAFTVNDDISLCCSLDNIATTDATCGAANGTATANASGGIMPYTYNWENVAAPGTSISTMNPATNLVAGSYNVTVTDANGCEVTGSTSINNTGGATLSNPMTTDATCGGADGTATITATGGLMPYTFNWENTANPGALVSTTNPATGLASGNYSVTVTDGNNCTAIETITVNDLGGPTLSNPTATDANCGGSDGTATITVSNGTMPYTFNWENTANPGTSVSIMNPATGLGAGTYNVTVSDANSCTAIEIVTVSDAGGPTVSGLTTTDATCGGTDGTATLTPTGGTMPYSFNWENAANPGASVSTSNPATGLAAGNYNITINDANNCATIEMVTINDIGGPALINPITTDATCGNADGTATITATGGIMPYTYDWENTANPGVLVSMATLVTDLPAGTYSVTVTDMNNCTVVETIIVNDLAGPILFNPISTDATCGSADGTANVTVTGGTMPYSFNWENTTSPGTSVSTTNPATGLAAATYNVTVSDANGCTAIETVNVSDAGSPTVVSVNTLPPTDCVTSEGTATITLTGGTPPYTDGSNVFNSTITINAQQGTTGNFTFEDINGCTVSGQYTIPVFAPDVSITNVDAMNITCINNIASITINAAGSNPPFQYSIDNGTTFQPGNTFSGVLVGSYVVIVQDALGCTVSSTAIIQDNSSTLAVSVTEQSTTCANTIDGQATATVTGGSAPYGYIWDNGEASASAIFLAPGTHTVTVTDAFGCTGISSVNIDAPAALTIQSVSSSPVTCVGGDDGTATLIPEGGTPPYTYQWNTGTPFGQTATGLTAGTYTVQVTDANGCQLGSPINITVTEPSSPLTVNSISGTDPTCFGENTGSATVEPIGGTTSYTYEWSNGATTQTALELIAGLYEVTITDANGCTIVDNVTISEPADISLSITTNNADCFGDTNGSIEVNDVSGGAGGPYLYSIDGENFILDTLFSGLTEGDYEVIAQDVNGCEAIVNTIITEPFELEVDLGDDVEITLGAGVDLYAVTNFPPDTTQTWIWTPDTNLEFGNLPYAPTASPGLTTTYQVTVTNEDGCTASDDIVVRVDNNRDVFIPNIFSPNFDGDNDIFMVYSGISVAQIRTMKVYNRWGEQMFEANSIPSNDSSFGWDGSMRGKQLNPGVFVYYVEVEFLDGEVIAYKGDVTIVK